MRFTEIITICLSFLFVSNSWSLTIEEKAAIVENVYKKVYSAMGLAEQRPKFVYDPKQESKIAYMMKDKDGNPIIGFEDKAFEVCATFGARRDEAIAYLLGHEISHHHFGHHWGTEFSSAYSVNNLITEMKAIDKDGIKKFETQADERGGIYCYLAGYNVQGICDGLLRKLYEAYGITNSPKYPSLEERIQIAVERDSIVSTYIKVFETANYAMLLREYDIAIDGYEYVIGKGFHSREIYNNLGVVYFLKGVDVSDPKISYLYPVEIDLESKTRAGTKGAADAESLFKSALEKFEQAIKFDNTYSTGYLNLACAHSVLKNYEDAEYMISKAIKAAKAEGRTNVEDNALLVKAIVLHQQPDADKDEMKKIMDGLIKKGNTFAKYNQLVFDKKSVEDFSTSGIPVNWTGEEVVTSANSTTAKETMDNIRSYEEDPDVLFVEEIQYTRFESILCGTREASTIYKVENSVQNIIYIFHAARPNYTGQTGKGIKIGSTKKQLIELYGYPDVMMNARQGSVMLYPNNKLIFVLDQNENISSWTLVRIL